MLKWKVPESGRERYMKKPFARTGYCALSQLFSV